MEKQELENKIIEVLKTVFDPEIPVNIFELGLVYEIKIDDDSNAKVIMTLTAPSCPIAEDIIEEVKEKLTTIEGLNQSEVELTFDPPWDMGMMTLEAKLELGFI